MAICRNVTSLGNLDFKIEFRFLLSLSFSFDTSGTRLFNGVGVEEMVTKSRDVIIVPFLAAWVWTDVDVDR